MVNHKIALLGQPNSGKSTIFNNLTGSHQHVGNWPGKTVEKKEGTFSFNGTAYTIADLPGSYSLSANSDEEVVTRDYIASGEAELVCILADSSQLERSLFMLADYAGINTPAMLVLTMTDVSEEKGRKIDVNALEKKLGIPVVSMVAPELKEYDKLKKAFENALKSPKYLNTDSLFEMYKQNELYSEALALVPENGKEHYSAEWLAAKLMDGDKVVAEMLSDKNSAYKFIEKAKNGSLITSDCKFDWISQLLDGTVTKTKTTSELLTKFDRNAIHPKKGKWIAIGIVLLALCGSMVIAAPFMGLGFAILPPLSSLVKNIVASAGGPEWLASLINTSICTPIGWVTAMVGFVFGVNLVFGYIEQVGYMARVSYVFDNVMNKLGLQGKSVMPLLMSFGCTMGGAAGSRVIDNHGQRLLTIALAWAVPCGAIFSVIPTLATAFFGWGSAIVMVFLLALMFLHMLVTAKIFGRKLSPKENRAGLIMELPPYHKPRWKDLIRTTLNNVWDTFKKAFSIVFVIATVFWLLSYSSNAGEASMLQKIGEAIEPFTKIFGLSWQSFMAFVASAVSKEGVLGVFSVVFTGDGSIIDMATKVTTADANIGEIMAAAISKAEGLALIVAVTFNVPCLMAVASTYHETHSLKWTLKIAAYYVVSALILAGITYHIANIFM
ncbi:MAG: ferrous iron transport protein B [Oscillospiraceae bacterium]|nr:ferrous iron transport protein B [Oscillospiraceae bacterium]